MSSGSESDASGESSRLSSDSDSDDEGDLDAFFNSNSELELDEDMDLESRVLKDLIVTDDKWMVKERPGTNAGRLALSVEPTAQPDEPNWDVI